MTHYSMVHFSYDNAVIMIKRKPYLCSSQTHCKPARESKNQSGSEEALLGNKCLTLSLIQGMENLEARCSSKLPV